MMNFGDLLKENLQILFMFWPCFSENNVKLQGMPKKPESPVCIWRTAVALTVQKEAKTFFFFHLVQQKIIF
jgi:hypothetical protein